MDAEAQTEGRSKSPNPVTVGTGAPLRVQKFVFKQGINPQSELR